MLGSSLQTEELEHSYADQHFEVSPGIGNPFPGLRPFTPDECHLYFGREGQVDELLLKLVGNRFVTVMGYSGSGKSSLMYCGLVPVLFGGLVTETSPNWQVLLSRPGDSPFDTLTSVIVQNLKDRGRIEESDVDVHTAIINSVLRSGPDGLVEVARYLQDEKGENIFLLIDQFEELFRDMDPDSYQEFDEIQSFVSLILHAVDQKEVPIYIAISMRSDFIGPCAQFAGLAEHINASNYLVPQMTRENKRMAIEGPVAVAGGRIAHRLVKKLLSDLGNQQDQLPILQHALMRTWDYWLANHEPGEPMDLRHYNAIGKIEQALSQHANETYDQLSTREKEIAEVLFKSITEKTQDNLGMRRPCRLGLIAELSEASESEVIQVVEHFRQSGRSFLMPSIQVSLTADSMVELSHESMMRIWNRLDKWVEEEFESAQIYKRISEAAAMYQIGKTGLWRPPDLQLALNWQRKQRPTRAWAERYDEAFERAIVFLDTSRITYEAELKNQEMLQKRMLRRARATAIILGVAALVAILFLVLAFLQKIEADSKRLLAQEAQTAAEQAQKVAEEKTKETEQALADLKVQQEATKAALKDAQTQREIAEQQKQIAEANLKAAQVAEEAAVVAGEKEKLQREKADSATVRATEQFNRANSLYMLTVAQALAAKSVQEDDDNDLAGLEAMQAYHFHTRYNGPTYDPYIYNGLYHALSRLNGSSYNAIKIPGPAKNRINSIAVVPGTNTFYAAGADGRIYANDYLNLTSKALSFANPFPNRVIAVTSDGQWLANGTDSSAVQLINLSNSQAKPKIISGMPGATYDLAFLPDNSALVVAKSNNAVYLVDYKSGTTTQLASLPYDIKTIDISPDGNWLAGASWSGKVMLMDLSKKIPQVIVSDSLSQILSVKFSPDGKTLAYGTYEKGDQRGIVRLYDLVNQKIEDRQFTGHRAGVYDVEFSPDGKLLASAGADKRIQMWVLDSPASLPVEMENNNGYIWDLAFANGSDYLIAACNESEIRVWPTKPSLLADQVCPKLKRNMTLDEWHKYVAPDINYENTCVRVLINDY